MQVPLQLSEALPLSENFSHQVFRAQETLAYILFAFGAVTAVVYGLISDWMDRSPRALRKAGWKVFWGAVVFVVLWWSFDPLYRFFMVKGIAMQPATGINTIGLLLSMWGTWKLLRGEMQQSAVLKRAQNIEVPPLPRSWRETIWLKLATRWAPKWIEEDPADPFPTKVSGLALLIIGFLVQAVARFLK